MWKVTRRGLAGHKLRFLLTALAVVLGVSFISGTLVLTSTIQKTFDDLFADINRGTDAAVRSANVIKGDFGNDQRANVPVRTGDIIPEIASDERAGHNEVYVVWQDARFNGFQRDQIAFSRSADVVP